MTTKKCSKCGVEKSLEEFHRNKSRKDGRIGRCKECVLGHTLKPVAKPGFKICLTCKEEKLLSEFHKSRGRSSGLSEHCKKCMCERSRRYREINGDKARQCVRNSFKKNPCLNYKWKKENPDKLRISKHKDYENHKERCSNSNKKWVENNPEGRKKILSRYYQTHPDQLTDRIKFRSYFAPEIFRRDNYKCVLCESSRGLNAHHINSWAKAPDRRFDISNCVTLCKDCHGIAHNGRKWKTINEEVKVRLENIIISKESQND